MLLNQLFSLTENILFTIGIIIIAGVILYFYKRDASKSKMLETTVTPESNHRNYQAKLIFKEKQEFLIREYEKVFGREDFLGILLSDDLKFVGKKHFKIKFIDNRYYIEDLNSKNGTKLNGEEIKGKGMKKLEDKSEIIIAEILKLQFLEYVL